MGKENYTKTLQTSQYAINHTYRISQNLTVQDPGLLIPLPIPPQQLALMFEQVNSVLFQSLSDFIDLLYATYGLSLIVVDMGCFESSAGGDGFHVSISGPGGSTLASSVNMKENFLAHHLRNEIGLSAYVRADRIKRRQIMEHCYIDENSHKFYGTSGSMTTSYTFKSWLQRLFFDCLEEAETEFFKEGRSYDQVRKKIADAFLFEIYQGCQFLNAASAALPYNDGGLADMILPLSYVAFSSDAGLYPVLKELKGKFPQVADNSKVKFPDVKEIKNDVNLLANIPDAKSFSDPKCLNLNTTLFDLEFLIERAISEYPDFKTDMEALLGKEVLADAKVKCEKRGDTKVYAASAVRRVFIKWVETMVERIPEIRETQAYIDFVKAKSVIIDNFHIKSGGFTTSIQETIIKVLLNLLEAIKFTRKGNQGDFVKNDKYGFFIYDLLRCKIHRNTPEEIMQVLDSMIKTSTTVSGKKFKVVRVKNRFNTPNRDLMVNFSYGDVIVAEAQLCVDASDVDEKAKKTNKFNHYLYELERGLFGPTIELMMQYEDFNLPNLITKMYFEGIVPVRPLKNKYKGAVKPAGRKCPSGHDMIECRENYFVKLEGATAESLESLTYSCDFCMEGGKSMNQPYHYCEKCSTSICLDCRKGYDEFFGGKPIPQHCNISTPELECKSAAEFKQKIMTSRAKVVLFYLDSSAPSIVMRDLLNNIYVLFKSLGRKLEFLYCRADLPENKPLLAQYELKKFPTLCVIDGQGKLHKSLIGASLQMIDGMDEFKNALISNPTSAALPVTCKNQKCPGLGTQQCAAKEFGEEEQEEWKCQQCHDITPEEGFSELFSFKDKKNAFQCPQCSKYVCVECGFLGYPDKASYSDPQGASYLSSQIKEPKQVSCTQNHPMTYVRKNVHRQSRYDCCKCNKNYFYNDDEGMAYCQQCSLFACPKCIGTQGDVNFQKKFEKQLVTHFTETAAPEAKKCTHCKNSIRKTYRSRIRKPVAEEDEFLELFSGALKEWNCCDCTREFKEGNLHLLCVSCKYEMCYPCAQKNVMFKTIDTAGDERPTPYHCDKQHPIVKSKKSPTPGATKVQCKCGSFLYPNTEHFACNECKTFLCKNCGLKEYREDGSPECDEGHQLVTRNKTPTPFGVICGKNRQHLISGNAFYYTCPKCEDYNVCNLGPCVGGGENTPKCDRGHALQIFNDPVWKPCENCEEDIGIRSVGCSICNQYICENCVS